MNWRQEQSICFIKKSLQTTGRLNRSDLAREFRISTQQAAADIKAAMEQNPNLMFYDRSAKCYRIADPANNQQPTDQQEIQSGQEVDCLLARFTLTPEGISEMERELKVPWSQWHTVPSFDLLGCYLRLIRRYLQKGNPHA